MEHPFNMPTPQGVAYPNVVKYKSSLLPVARISSGKLNLLSKSLFDFS